MWTLALATAAVVAVAAPAAATDLAPWRQPLLPMSPMPSLSEWGGGVHAGVNAGDDPAVESEGSGPGPSVATAAPPRGWSADGRFAGGHIGFNREIGPWLLDLPVMLGVEFSADWAGLGAAAPPAGAAAVTLDDLETVTARFGVALHKWLLYAKAGGATGALNLRAVGAGFDQTNRAVGTIVAGGIQYGLTANLVVGVEYDFVRLLPGNFAGTVANGVVFSDSPAWFDVHSVAGRLSYRF